MKTYTRKEAAKKLGVSLRTLDYRIADGTLTPLENPMRKRPLLFNAQEIDELAAVCETISPAEAGE